MHNVFLEWFAYHMGIFPVAQGATSWGLFWSGFGSCLSEFAIPLAVYSFWKKHNCHSARCLRIGRHVVGGTPWCNKHHQAARERLSPKQVNAVTELI